MSKLETRRCAPNEEPRRRKDWRRRVRVRDLALVYGVPPTRPPVAANASSGIQRIGARSAGPSLGVGGATEYTFRISPARPRDSPKSP